MYQFSEVQGFQLQCVFPLLSVHQDVLEIVQTCSQHQFVEYHSFPHRYNQDSLQ